MIENALFLLFAGAAALGALAMLVLRHPMHVAMALIAVMISLGSLYGLLGVHVIAVFQIMIYVGAVMVFMVYVIMLLEIRESAGMARYSALVIPGVVATVLFVGALGYGVWHGYPALIRAAAGTRFGIHQFSISFLTEYWLHFELTSVLLVAAVVAALAVIKVSRRAHG